MKPLSDLPCPFEKQAPEMRLIDSFELFTRDRFSVCKGLQVTDSVVMHGCRIGRHSVVSKAILDKNVVLEEGATVGLDLEHDRQRGFTVTDSGITIVPKGMVITR